MDILLGDGEVRELDIATLAGDLLREGIELVTVSKVGELVVDDMSHGEDYAYRREVWYARLPGEGANNQKWGGFEWEFARSIRMGDED